ncbi:hypothetical protein Purlil1_13123 [Purpureocillium lilacinum]|uniref:C2H2-type domain-containing protein n=1 Tax=Purpureocillium lilacinum TaxID=33203 RepID=A0ABR0BF60_PURLI|nr:hypothetical protein Purlil1_13123 [Purpureocillium lilacinum]
MSSRLRHNAAPELAPVDEGLDRHVDLEPVKAATLPRPTPRVIEKLRALGLHYNEPERAILCSRCGFALKADADRVSRHLGEKHRVLGKARKGLNHLVQNLQLPDPCSLQARPDHSEKHHHLALQRGAACKHCKFRSTSLELLSRHLKKIHQHEVKSRGRNDRWLRDHIDDGLVFQSWMANDISNAWIVEADATDSGSLRLAAAHDHPDHAVFRRRADEICAEETRRLSSAAPCTTPNTNASTPAIMMTNWMRRTGWEETFRHARRDFLVSLSELPAAHSGPLLLTRYDGATIQSPEVDECRLVSIVHSLDRLLDRCGETVRRTDVSIRRWLRSRFPDRPFKAPFELVATSHAEKQYRRLLKRCICFWIRFWRLPRQVTKKLTGRTLYAAQVGAISMLWNDPVWGEYHSMEHQWRGERDLASSNYESEPEDGESREEMEGCEYDEGTDDMDSDQESLRDDDGVDDDDVCSTASTEMEYHNGKADSTLLTYFTGVCGLSLPNGSEFLGPGKYTTHLSGFIYCVRLILLEAALPCFSHEYVGIKVRPRRGQVEILQRLRQEKMCDGTMSPLGEMISLFTFGTALRQSDGPTFCFEWSDDGETIAWDGDCRLSMTDFRGLVHEVLESATRASQHLMYDWDPPEPDFKRIRDRLSTSTAGYSFVTDSANELQLAHFELFTRACLSPVDCLLQKTRDGESAWDRAVVSKYLESHDDLLKMLMLLFHLGGGQGSRISELLTIEHSNTSSRLRGVGFYAGRMFSVTRHHKSRLTTNNEFQFARFLPQPSARLAYNYLVFIRRTAHLLLRTCFQQDEDNSLLFAPVAKAGSWRTDTLARELHFFSRHCSGWPVGIGPRLYRQLSIAITERHIRAIAGHFNRHDDTSVGSDPAAVFAWQSGHRPRQRFSTYGLDGAYPDKLQPALLQLYLDASIQWHEFLGFRAGPQEGDADQSPPRNCRTSDFGKKGRSRKRRVEEGPGSPEMQQAKKACGSCGGGAGGREEHQISQPGAPKGLDVLSAIERDAQDEIGSPDEHCAQPKDAESSPLGPFAFIPDLSLVICRICEHAVLGNEAQTHLRCKHRSRWTMQQRSAIAGRVRDLPGILREQEDLQRFTLPAPTTPPIPYIGAPKDDGLQCDACGYVTRTTTKMRLHCRNKHGWTNDSRKRRILKRVTGVLPTQPWSEGLDALLGQHLKAFKTRKLRACLDIFNGDLDSDLYAARFCEHTWAGVLKIVCWYVRSDFRPNGLPEEGGAEPADAETSTQAASLTDAFRNYAASPCPYGPETRSDDGARGSRGPHDGNDEWTVVVAAACRLVCGVSAVTKPAAKPATTGDGQVIVVDETRRMAESKPADRDGRRKALTDKARENGTTKCKLTCGREVLAKNARISEPVLASQSRAVLSLDSVTTTFPSGEKATARTQPEWPRRTLRSVPVDASQSRDVQSDDPVASTFPSGEKATARTQPEWPRKTVRSVPEVASQSRAVLSMDAVATMFPSGEKATAHTSCKWPLSTLRSVPEVASQSRAVLSLDAVAIISPSGEKATART